jgi:hypothetical protein
MTKRRRKHEEEKKEKKEKKKKNFSVIPFKGFPTQYIRFLWQFQKPLKRVLPYLFH